jgi:hypothetical protein
MEGANEPRWLDREDADAFAERAVEVRLRSFGQAEIHQTAADRWGTINYTLGLPIVVLSAIASTAALADFDKSNVVAGIIALVVAILSALATFLNAQKTSELHRVANANYVTLALRAEQFERDIMRSGGSYEEGLERVHALEDEHAKLLRESPSYSRRTRRRSPQVLPAPRA